MFALCGCGLSQQPNTQKRMYGTWHIERALQTNNISGLDEHGVRGMIGKTIIYTKTVFISEGHRVPNPNYNLKTLTDAEFFKVAYIPLSELKIRHDHVTILTVSDDHHNKSELIGSEVYLGGPSPVVLIDGVFFQLARL
jgi:hypothetical protein